MKPEDELWVDRMAASMVEQVAPFLPPGVELGVEGHGMSLMLVLVADRPGRSGYGFGSIATQEGDLPRMNYVVGAVHVFLDHVQDFMALHTGTPWPGTSTIMPMVRSAVDGNRIDVWFGDEATRTTFPMVTVEVG